VSSEETPTIKRTPREWDEPCNECHGTGTVHRREWFALWTPDEYSGTVTLDPKHDIPANAYVCTAVPGADIFRACAEAADLAKRVGRPIAFEFNGAVAIVHADSDTSDAAKRWWKLAYGKSYEQSMCDR